RWGPEWPETLNTLVFTEKGGKTTVSITVHYPSKEARDTAFKTGMASGVEVSFQRLADHLAGMSVVIERTYDAPLEKVWRALTDETQMKQWYFPTMPAFKPVVGFETQVDVEHEGKV